MQNNLLYAQYEKIESPQRSKFKLLFSMLKTVLIFVIMTSLYASIIVWLMVSYQEFHPMMIVIATAAALVFRIIEELSKKVIS